jgi:hypothetical protein
MKSFVNTLAQAAPTRLDANVRAARLVNVLMGNYRDSTGRPMVAMADTWRLVLEDYERATGNRIAIDVIVVDDTREV